MPRVVVIGIGLVELAVPAVAPLYQFKVQLADAVAAKGKAVSF